MESSGTKGWVVASVTMLALVFVLALTLTIALLDEDGRDGSEADGPGARLTRLEQELDDAPRVANNAGNQAAAKPAGDPAGKKGPARSVIRGCKAIEGGPGRPGPRFASFGPRGKGSRPGPR